MTDILIVDDHEVVHWGMRSLLSSQEWVGRCLSAHNAEEALQICQRYEPDVALVDLFLGADSGAELCERLRSQHPQIKVLLLSGAGRISAAAARAAGASGFMPKDWPASQVCEAVKAVAAGKLVFEGDSTPKSPGGLSPREREILQLISTGATNPEIAKALHLSPHTVKEHSSSLYRKLSVRNRAEAVREANKLGLI